MGLMDLMIELNLHQVLNIWLRS